MEQEMATVPHLNITTSVFGRDSIEMTAVQELRKNQEGESIIISKVKQHRTAVSV